MTFSRFKGGRRPPHPAFARPRLWIDDFLPPGPATAEKAEIDFYTAVPAFPMDLNGPDPSNPAGMEGGAGTCGIAGMDHLQMAWNTYAHGSGPSWGNDTVLSLYEYLSGYRRGDPTTDNGTVLQDNLDFWRKQGVNGDKILFFGALRPGSWLRPERVKALQAFGGIYLGHNWPTSAEAQFPHDLTYVPRSALAGGHATIQHGEMLGRNEVRLGCWAKVVRASSGFLLHTVEEAWVVGATDFIEVNGKNPSGIDVAGMNDALAALTRTSNPLGIKTIL